MHFNRSSFSPHHMDPHTCFCQACHDHDPEPLPPSKRMRALQPTVCPTCSRWYDGALFPPLPFDVRCAHGRQGSGRHCVCRLRPMPLTTTAATPRCAGPAPECRSTFTIPGNSFQWNWTHIVTWVILSLVHLVASPLFGSLWSCFCLHPCGQPACPSLPYLVW